MRCTGGNLTLCCRVRIDREFTSSSLNLNKAFKFLCFNGGNTTLFAGQGLFNQDFLSEIFRHETNALCQQFTLTLSLNLCCNDILCATSLIHKKS